MTQRKKTNIKHIQAKHIQKRIERNDFDNKSTPIYKNSHHYIRKLKK
jgi:hypothetical protein